jgi:NADPH:quinone reductase-like Zn-dependent oxidoreductase
MILYNASEAEMRSLWAGIEAGLEDQTLRPVVSTVLPLAEAPRAHREVMSGKALGKIVLVP